MKIVFLLSFLSFIGNQLYSQKIDIDWANIGPGGGGTTYVPAISPHNPDLMFISCDMSGVYRSTNGGKEWTMLNYHQINGSISCPPVFHPSDPNIIWDEMSNQLMKSTDAGITWQKVWDMPSTAAALLCMRNEPLCLLVSVNGDGLYYSNDGINFFKKGNIKPQYLAEDVNLIVAADNNNLWYSTDRGSSYNNLYTFSETIQDIAVSDSGIFVITAKFCVRFKNFIQDNKPLLLADSLKRGDFKFIRAERNFVWITPGNNNATYQPTAYLSTDGGNSFKGTFYCNGNNGETPNSIPDWLSIEFNCWWGGAAMGFCIARQNPGLAIWTDMGRSFITSDTGKSWWPDFTEFVDVGSRTNGKKWKTTGLDITTNWDVFINPDDKNYYQIAYTDIGGSISEDGGNSWRTTYNTGIPNDWFNTNYNFAYDKDNNLLWGAFAQKHDISSWNGAGWNPGAYNKGGICYSTNEGKNWTPVDKAGLPDLPVTCLAIDYTSPASSRRIYAAVFTSGIWKTEDGGKSWVKCSNGLDTGDSTSTIDGPNNHITEVQVYPNADVFAIKSMYLRQVTAKNDGGLWRSTNNGNSWVFISSNVNGCDPVNGIDTKQEHSWAYPTTFLVDENNENHIYVGAQMCNYGKIQGGLYETTDGGTNWNRILQIYGAVRLTKSKYYPGRYYLATCGNGMMYSNDNMKNWIEDSLIPFSYLTRITEDIHDSSVIWINTFGGSVWKGVINSKTSGISDDSSYNDDYLKVNPNPFNETIKINSNYSKIEIYNINGELIQTLNQNQSQWTPDKTVCTGLYEIVAKKGSKIEVKKVVFIR